MSRYKFRAWHKTAKEMFSNYAAADVFSWLDDGQPVEIMQWTGLTDKNGVDIYESDLIMINDSGCGMKGDAPAKVVFSHGYVGGWVLTVDGIHHLNMGNRTGCLEVIGNIYANPELMEQAK